MKFPLLNPNRLMLDAIPAGYYWVQNKGLDLETGKDRPVHRIIHLIEIKSRGSGSWNQGGYWKGEWYDSGVYYEDGKYLRKLSSYIDGWEDVKIEPVKPASFAQ